jgi:predicted metal-dependent peptidase
MLYDLSKLNAAERIMRAKIQLYKQSPFFAYILLHMKPTKDEKVPSMGVNARGDLFYNEKFVMGLKHEELVGVLCHEACHIALMHLTRTKGRSPQIMNIANDLAVNNILVAEQYQLPKCGLIPKNNQFEFEDLKHTVKDINQKSSELMYDEIYPLIPKQIGGGGPGNGNKKLPEGFDEHIYGGGDKDSEEDGKDGLKDGLGTERGTKKIIAEAAQLAKQQGKLPAGFERLIDDILDSKLNWKEKLYKYIVETIIYDYTWRLPSKRTAALGIYTPRPLKEGLQIVVMVDTSGSIGGDELKSFLSEMVNITQSFVNVKMDVIICDAQVHETYTLSGDSVDAILSMRMSGGGGTDHRSAFNYVLKNIPDTKVVVAFTDLYTTFPEKFANFSFDTLWVVQKGGAPSDTAPFGEVIRVE